jgi:hypothetical protein
MEPMDIWHNEINRATTEEEVVRSARDYLTMWSPQELAPLVRDCSDVRVRSSSDIERLKASAFNAAPLNANMDELATYLWSAASRIGEIRRARFSVVPR